jgi:hypothetical protein
MGTAAYGQTLLEASMKLAIDWTLPFPMLAPCTTTSSQANRTDGYVDIKVLGHFKLKGVPDPAVLAEALPRRLKNRPFPVPPERIDAFHSTEGVPEQSVSCSTGRKRTQAPFANANGPLSSRITVSSLRSDSRAESIVSGTTSAKPSDAPKQMPLSSGKPSDAQPTRSLCRSVSSSEMGDIMEVV